MGQFDLAIASLTQAVSLAVDRSTAYQEAWLLVSLARALLASGDAVETARHAFLALELAVSRGFQVIRARALSVLGEHARAAEIFERCTGSALHAPASVLSFEPSCTFCS